MKELINSLIINKCKKSNIFDILMEFIFLILQGIVISHIYKLNKLNVSPPSRIIFFLFLIYIVCDTLLLILEYVKCEKISKFKLFRFSLINYMVYFILTVLYNFNQILFDKYIYYIIVYSLIYRAYVFIYFEDLTHFSNIALSITFVIIIFLIISMDESMYNYLLVILTFIISIVDKNTLLNLFKVQTDKEIDSKEFNEIQFFQDKFNILKILIIIYPTIGICDFLFNNFYTFIGINKCFDKLQYNVFILQLRFLVAFSLYFILSTFFSSKFFKNYIDNKYFKKNDEL